MQMIEKRQLTRHHLNVFLQKRVHVSAFEDMLFEINWFGLEFSFLPPCVLGRLRYLVVTLHQTF